MWLLEVHGKAGVDALGLTADGSLVASQAALDCLMRHTIQHAQLAQFVGAEDARRARARAAEAGERPAAASDDSPGRPRPFFG
jgi:hypothetical protein